MKGVKFEIGTTSPSITQTLGNRVIVRSFQFMNQKGTIKYIGPVQTMMQDQLGVVLDLPKGKHNGTFNSKVYFQCKARHGIFVLPNQVKLLPDQPNQEVKKQQPESIVTPTKQPATTGLKPPTPRLEKKEEENKSKNIMDVIFILAPRTLAKPTKGLRQPSSRGTTPRQAAGSSRPVTPTKEPDDQEKQKKTMKTPRGLQDPSAKPPSSGVGSGIGRGLVKPGTATTAAGDNKVKKISASAVQKKTVDAPASISVPGKMAKPGTGIGGGGSKQVPKRQPLGLQRPAATGNQSKSNLVIKAPVKSGVKTIAQRGAIGQKKEHLNTSLNKGSGKMKSTTFEFEEEQDQEQQPTSTSKLQEEGSEQEQKKIEETKKPLPMPKLNIAEMQKQFDDQIGVEDEDEIDSQSQFQSIDIQAIKANSDALQAENSKFKTKIQTLEANLKTIKEEKIKQTAKMKSQIQGKQNQLKELKESFEKKSQELRMEINTEKQKDKGKEAIQELEKKSNEIKQLTTQLQKLTQQKKSSQKEVTDLQAEVEDLKTQIQIEKQQKDIIKMQAEQAQQQAMADVVTDNTGILSQDQLRAQNQRLKIALRQITAQFQIEKATKAQEIVQLQDQLSQSQAIQQQLNAKQGDVDFLIEQVENLEKKLQEKETVVKELQVAIDQNGDNDLMIQNLTRQVVQLEDQVEQGKIQVQSVKEELQLESELTNQAQKYSEILLGELESKKADVIFANKDIVKLREEIVSLEGLIAKFRERVSDLSNQNSSLTMQIDSSTQGEMRQKISFLLDKQTTLTNKLRDAYRKQLSLRESQISQNQNRAKTDWLLSFLPLNLLQQARIDCFEKVQLIQTVKCKSYLLLKEIADSSFMRTTQGNKQAAKIENIDLDIFFRWNCQLYYNVSNLLDVILRISFVLLSIGIDDYHQITTLDAWGNLMAAQNFLDNFLKLTKEENLSPKMSQNVFISTIGAIEEFYFKSIAPKCPNSSQSGEEIDVLNPPKLSTRQSLVLINLAILAVNRCTSLQNQANLNQQRFDSLLTHIDIIIHKIDKIPQNDSGIQYILPEFQLSKKLETKFDFAEVLWREQDPNDEQSRNASTNARQGYDWMSWLMAIQLDISSLDRSQAFKRISQIPDNYSDHCQAFLLKQIGSGPWDDIAENIKKQLQRAASQAQQIRQLNTDLSKMRGNVNILQKEIKDHAIIKQSLERKLGEQSQKAMRVPALQDENKRLNEYNTTYQQSLNECKQVIENLNEAKKDLTKKLANAGSSGPNLEQNSSINTGSIRRMGTVVGTGAGGVGGGSMSRQNMRSRIDFNQRILFGDSKTISSEYKDMIKRLMGQAAENRHGRSIHLLNRINADKSSAFNRYLQMKKPENEDFKKFIDKKLEGFNSAIQKLKEKQGCVKIIDLCKDVKTKLQQNFHSYNTINSLRKQQEQKRALMLKAKQYAYEFKQAIKKRHPNLLDSISNEAVAKRINQ